MSIRLKRFSDLKIKTRLYLLSALTLFWFGGIIFISNLYIDTTKTQLLLRNQDKIYFQKVDIGIQEFYKYLNSSDQSRFDNAINLIDKANDIVFYYSRFDSLTQSKGEDWSNFFYETYKEGFYYDRESSDLVFSQMKIIVKYAPEFINEAFQLAYKSYLYGLEVKNLMLKISRDENIEENLMLLDSIVKNLHTESLEYGNLMNDIFNKIVYYLKLVSFVILSILTLLTILFSWLISRTISKPVKRLVENFKNIAKGNLESTSYIDSESELGELSQASMGIQVDLQNIISYCNDVAKGDYTLKIKPKSEKDELSHALNTMADKLLKSREATEKENWLKNGQNELNKQIIGELSVIEISERILDYISNFLEVELGSIYVFDSEENRLEIAASKGIAKKNLKKYLAIGEGLIGEAAKTNKITSVKTNGKFHKVFSSSGEIIPDEIYLIPLTYNNEIVGVIELAPINKLPALSIKFLNDIKDRLAVNVNAAVGRYRLQELLKKTQEQSEELKTHQEQLQKNLEERQAIMNELEIRIQENEKMQVSLEWEKSLLDSLLNNIPATIYFKDLESKFIKVSKSLAQVFNIDNPKELEGKSDFDFHTEEHAKEAYAAEQEIIKTKKPKVNVVEKTKWKDGSDRYVSSSKLPLISKEGEVLGTFGISTDITQIKQMEAQLEWEKSLLDSLLDNIPDSIYFKDLESRFLKISKSMVKLFGVKKVDEVEGKTDFDFQDEEHAKEAFEDEQKIIKTKKGVVGIVEREVFEGEERFVSTTKMPLTNRKGEVLGTFGISRDITKVKQMENEIKRRNEELQEQQEMLQATNEELKSQEEELRVINEELKSQEEELRVANEELEEQTKVLIENEKNLQVQQEELKVANEELEEKSHQLEIQKKEIVKKNTDLLKTQNDLIVKAQELEQTSQYKSEFLANMSHELRTPLNSLLILSRILGENRKGNLSEDQVKSVKIIYKSGSDLLQLINEILDLSKIEAGKINIELADVKTTDLITEIDLFFKPVAEEKKLSLEIVKDQQFPELLHTDQLRLMQIIKNLLSNAFKFTSQGGITVSFLLPDKNTVLVNSELNASNTYQIAVRDTGVGIPKDKKDAIFEAFQQADGSISRKFGGTGLGLSISKELTRLLEGEIQVESIEGEGSVFSVFFPLDKNYKSEKSSKSKEKQIIKKVSVEAPVPKEKGINKTPLFINDDRDKGHDNPMVLIVYPDKEKAKKLLEQCNTRGYNAVVAQNIGDGLLLAEEFKPSAIILSADLNKPEFLKQFHENKNTLNLPIHQVAKIDDEALQSLKEIKTFGGISSALEGVTNSNQNSIKTVLIVEDDPVTLEAVHMVLEGHDFDIHDANTGQKAFEAIQSFQYDCVVLDLGLPDFTGNELLQKLHDEDINIPNVIIYTAKELSEKELKSLHKFTNSIVIKGIKSEERLMDEITLFLHQVSSTLKRKKPTTQESGKDDFAGKKILVVDDDIRNIFALGQILEEKEIEVLEAENGKVAIDVLKENPDIDLVLMDIMMPEMDGYEAMTEIRKIPEFKEIPIITITAKAMKEDYQESINHGANDYISKPVDEAKLFSLLKIWLLNK